MIAVVVEAMTVAGADVVHLPPVGHSLSRMAGLAAAIAQLPSLDILVNLIGFDRGAPVQSVCEQELDDVIEEAVEGSFLVSQAAADRMRSRAVAETLASIVHVGTPLARVGASDRSVCCMAMHALRGLTMASAVELGPMGIRVNLLEASLDENCDRALSRGASVEGLAASIVYLSSSAAAGMTGASLLLDAGWTSR
jgi:NAD(P)-dependent dehydrogenase (short-subunit alcohol dehydrogenase family)